MAGHVPAYHHAFVPGNEFHLMLRRTVLNSALAKNASGTYIGLPLLIQPAANSSYTVCESYMNPFQCSTTAAPGLRCA